MMIDSKMAGSNPVKGKEGTGLYLRNKDGFGAVKSPRPAPSIKRETGLG